MKKTADNQDPKKMEYSELVTEMRSLRREAAAYERGTVGWHPRMHALRKEREHRDLMASLNAALEQENARAALEEARTKSGFAKARRVEIEAFNDGELEDAPRQRR